MIKLVKVVKLFFLAAAILFVGTADALPDGLLVLASVIFLISGTIVFNKRER